MIVNMSVVLVFFSLQPSRNRLMQVLMTREYRARLAAGGGPPPKAPTFAIVRVRLPEGLLLQGEFNAGEPVCKPAVCYGRACTRL